MIFFISSTLSFAYYYANGVMEPMKLIILIKILIKICVVKFIHKNYCLDS